MLSRDDRKEVADGQIPVQPLETDLKFRMNLADVCEILTIAPLFFCWHFPSKALGRSYHVDDVATMCCDNAVLERDAICQGDEEWESTEKRLGKKGKEFFVAMAKEAKEKAESAD